MAATLGIGDSSYPTLTFTRKSDASSLSWRDARPLPQGMALRCLIAARAADEKQACKGARGPYSAAA